MTKDENISTPPSLVNQNTTNNNKTSNVNDTMQDKSDEKDKNHMNIHKKDKQDPQDPNPPPQPQPDSQNSKETKKKNDELNNKTAAVGDGWVTISEQEPVFSPHRSSLANALKSTKLINSSNSTTEKKMDASIDGSGEKLDFEIENHAQKRPREEMESPQRDDNDVMSLVDSDDYSKTMDMENHDDESVDMVSVSNCASVKSFDFDDGSDSDSDVENIQNDIYFSKRFDADLVVKSI